VPRNRLYLHTFRLLSRMLSRCSPFQCGALVRLGGVAVLSRHWSQMIRLEPPLTRGLCAASLPLALAQRPAFASCRRGNATDSVPHGRACPCAVLGTQTVWLTLRAPQADRGRTRQGGVGTRWPTGAGCLLVGSRPWIQRCGLADEGGLAGLSGHCGQGTLRLSSAVLWPETGRRPCWLIEPKAGRAVLTRQFPIGLRFAGTLDRNLAKAPPKGHFRAEATALTRRLQVRPVDGQLRAVETWSPSAGPISPGGGLPMRMPGQLAAGGLAHGPGRGRLRPLTPYGAQSQAPWPLFESSTAIRQQPRGSTRDWRDETLHTRQATSRQQTPLGAVCTFWQSPL